MDNESTIPKPEDIQSVDDCLKLAARYFAMERMNYVSSRSLFPIFGATPPVALYFQRALALLEAQPNAKKESEVRVELATYLSYGQEKKSPRVDEALAQIDKALELDPKDLTARVIAAQLHHFRGEYAKSAAQYFTLAGVNGGLSFLTADVFWLSRGLKEKYKALTK